MELIELLHVQLLHVRLTKPREVSLKGEGWGGVAETFADKPMWGKRLRGVTVGAKF